MKKRNRVSLFFSGQANARVSPGWCNQMRKSDGMTSDTEKPSSRQSLMVLPVRAGPTKITASYFPAIEAVHRFSTYRAGVLIPFDRVASAKCSIITLATASDIPHSPRCFYGICYITSNFFSTSKTLFILRVSGNFWICNAIGLVHRQLLAALNKSLGCNPQSRL